MYDIHVHDYNTHFAHRPTICIKVTILSMAPLYLVVKSTYIEVKVQSKSSTNL